MGRSPRRRTCVHVLLPFALCLAGCISEEERVYRAAIEAAYAAHQCRDIDAQHGEIDVAAVGTGHAVVLRPVYSSGNNPEYIYWVSNNKVFAVNGLAAKCAPQMPRAPEAVAEAVYAELREE